MSIFKLINISEEKLLQDRKNPSENNYYVYELLNTSLSNEEFPNGKPFYVGKGRHIRCITHFTPNKRRLNSWLYRKINKLVRNKIIINVRLIEYGLTEQAAFEKEILFIKKYREKNIKLSNTTNGGEGASKNFVSAETREKMSKAHTGLTRKQESIRKTIETRMANGSYAFTEEAKNKSSQTHAAKKENYFAVDPLLNVFHVTNLKKFCKTHTLSFSRMNQIARSNIGVLYKGGTYKEKKYVKKNKTYKGWECFYEKDFSINKIRQFRYNLYDLEGKFIKSFQKISELAKEYKVSEACLARNALKFNKPYKNLVVKRNPNY